MRVCLYNSFPLNTDGNFDKIIWCPLSRDILHIVHFFRKYSEGKKIYIETVFRQYIQNNINDKDLVYFDPGQKYINKTKRLIAFYSQSDTLANNTLCLISGQPEYSFLNFIPHSETENSDIFFEKENIPFLKFSFRHLKKSKPDVLVMYNDWTKASIRIIAQCHLFGIPVVCIQESIIDFGDSFHRMQNADNVIIQGSKTAIELKRKRFYLTGNPRYSRSHERIRNGEYVLINCNFTYNIFEEIRYSWLDDITSALDELGVKYLISQHPRDKGDLSRYKNYVKSSSSGLKKQLANAGIVITRFSSIIHESLIDGIPVIYYNPHNEHMQYDFDFNSEFLLIAKNKNELISFVSSLYNKDISGEMLDFYLNVHCLPAETNPVANINTLLAHGSFITGKFSVRDFLRLVFYQPFIVNTLKKIRLLSPGHFKLIN